MRATIKMIAERAGVSIGTVDRVLHDRPYVKEEVRRRVLEVMEELDYQPNRVASALATSGMARHFAIIQPTWESYVGEAMAAGVAKFRQDRQDYNVSVTIHPYRQGRMEDCLHLLDTLAEEVQGIALCAADCPQVRQKLELLAERRMPVVTFNSDIAGARRLCYVGEDAHHAGRVAGDIAAKFLRPGDRILLVYADHGYAGHKGRADGFLERLAERGLRQEDCRVAETHDNYDETLAAVTAALAEEPDLKYIYMANRSVPACMEALRGAGRMGQVRVLAHDNSPETRTFLREGLLDFIIDQNLTYQSRKALSLLFDAVVEHRTPERFLSGEPYPHGGELLKDFLRRRLPAEADSGGSCFWEKLCTQTEGEPCHGTDEKAAAWGGTAAGGPGICAGDLRICDCGHSAGDRGGAEHLSGGSGKAGIGVRRLLRGGDACDHCSYRRNFPPEAAGGADGGVPPHQRGKLCRS